MKITRFLILGLVLTAMVCGAQITDPGYFIAQQRPLPDAWPTNETPQFNPMNQPNVPDAAIAEVVTPEIQALADGLQDNPLKIYNYVHDHIRHVLYFGSKKGAQLTLLEKSGNDFDQCALLVAMLQAAGYTNASYQFGWMLLPYDNADGSHRDLHHWLQLTLNNTNWLNTSNYLINLFFLQRGYPDFRVMQDGNTFAFQRTWVTLTIGSTNYLLDPAFKVSEPITNILNLSSAMQFSSNGLMSAAAGTDAGTYVTNLNEANLRGALTTYTTNLLSYIQSNCPNASMEQMLGGWQIVPSTNTTLSQSLIFTTTNWGGVLPVLNWTYEPTNLMTQLTITFASTNYQCPVPQLGGKRLALTYDTNGLAQLWQDDTLLAQHAASGVTNSVIFYVNHPVGTWNHASNSYVDSTYNDTTVTTSYQSTNASYALLYAFEPDWGWLKERQNQLDNYRAQGLSDTSRQVVSETLNVMGLSWLLQTEYEQRVLAAQMGVLPMNYHRLGRMGQEAGRGYYVDAYMQLADPVPAGGNGTGSWAQAYRWFDLTGYFGSALEHGLIEELQNTNLVGASTAKMLQIANTNGQAVYLANSANWTAGANVRSKLVNYDSGTLTTIGNLISSNYYVLLPQNGSNHVTGTTGSWAGYGFAANLYGQTMLMQISGRYQGGYVSDPAVTVNTPVVVQTGNSQPTYYFTTPTATPNPPTADPVDTADGTFQVETADLSLGQSEPRGITLSRYYNGTRRFSNPAGMAGGWIHNYSVNASTVAAPQATFGGTTPAQAAPMLAATCAAIGLYNDIQPDPKNWMVTTLIAKWGVDQLTKNGVSIALGKDTIQFVKQPDGSFTAPANCTMTLIQTNSVYWLQQRHGNTFKFDTLGRLANIVDQYSQPLNIAYLSSTSNLPQTVTDWMNRTLTFNYTGTPQRLTSVADSTGRSVAYGYTTNAAGQLDLASVTDPESNTSTYSYDTNHQVIATKDALGQLVVTNIYDGFGRVMTQCTQGDTNKIWQIFWSGWRNVEQDPAGSQRVFYYDDKSRLIVLQDALGSLSQMSYDGQNHAVVTVSPLNETNRFVYDGNHNLMQTIDPLGYTNQFVYDSQNNLIRAVDSRGNTNRFGYNAKFQLTGSTNAAGDWVTFAYNGSDGTLQSRSDPAGSTSYGYDSYGLLNSITYPGTLGSESFLNSANGDVLSRTNARQFVTSFQYNLRRQLTNTIAPTNLTATVAYDAVGNVFSTTDARTNTTSNTWSATRHLTGTVFPSTPQGAPATTNIYDSRDWLSRALNPLQQAMLFTNDAAGRLVSATDPLQRTTTFGYDADGRGLTATNAALEVTRQQWDARGELTKVTNAATNVVSRVYDAAGNQTTLTNRNGKKWQFQFDAANRLTNTITPLNRQTTQVYNNRGLLQSITEPSTQTANFYYDGKGRLTNRNDNVGTTLYGYDANNNVTSVVEAGKTNSCTFDAYDRTSSYRDADGNLIQYRYDANGNVTNLVYPGGKTVAYFYDSLNRLTNVTDWASRQTTFAYDLASRLTSITRPNGSQRIIAYDAAGETTNIVEKLTNNAPIAFFKFNYDNAARAQWEFAGPLPHAYTPPTRTMTFDDDNRLATINSQNVTNDLDGNMTWGPLTNNAFTSYNYDARNRLTSAAGLSYAYDPACNRVAITNGATVTKYVINPNAVLPQVLLRVRGGVTNYYVYGMGLLYEADDAGNTKTYHYDYRGSTVAITDNNGIPTDRIEYSAYGAITYRVGNTDTPFLFNGRYGVQTDANGLLYMRARYYNPYLCRFLNPDPAGFSGGLNFYAYADGNPVSLIDPFGLGAKETGGFFSWIGNAIRGFFTDAYNGLTSTDPLVQQTVISEILMFTPAVAELGSLGAAEEATVTEEATVARQTTVAVEAAAADARAVTVLGSRRDVAPYVGRPGFNTFTGEGIAPAKWDRQNALWLNQAIVRGDDIWLVTDPAAHAALLRSLPETPQSAYLNLELPMLNQYRGVNAIPRYVTLPAP